METLEDSGGERGSGTGEYDGRCILRRLQAETHRTVLHEVRQKRLQRLRGATSAAQRASSPLATAAVQHVDSSAIAGAQQDVT